MKEDKDDTTGKIQKSLKISISDTGLGMNEEEKEKIFEPFFTTKKLGQSIGLGMSISYGIIQDHKGQILVESQKGSGTTFTLILPLDSSTKN